jgi:type IX secretion system substrate protein/SprB-like repeat protein
MKRFLLYIPLLFSIFIFNNFEAQVVQIGSGTATSAIDQASPVNIYWRRNVSQIVYTAAEINAAGATGPNTLSQMGFYVTSNPVYDIPGYTIKLKNTSVSSLNNANTLGATGWTTVKNSFTYAPNPGGYDMIVFDTPFVWDGVSNIGVEICWSQVQPNYNSSGQCRIYNYNRGYRYTWDDNTGSLCGSTTGNRVNTKPQVQFTFKTTSTWNGSVSADWFNANNWDAGIPDKEMNALIPAAASIMPIITALGAECKNLEIENSASLTLSGSNEISIYGNWTNNGTFTANTGNVILTGKSTNLINGANNQTLYDLTVSNVNGASILSGSINLYGSLNVGIAAGSFNTGNAITLMSDANGTARIPELASLCLYRLDMSDSWGDSWNGGYITVNIDGVPSGTYFAKGSNTVDTIPVGGGSTLELVYTPGSFEDENTYTLYDPSGVAVFSDGVNPSTGSVFSTSSNCSFFNPIAGNITMQRYIDAGETNWRFLTSPVSGATLADWNDDFITSGFIGSDFPDWPSVTDRWPSIYYYDETVVGGVDDGYVAATNISNAIGVGQGLWVWSGDTIIGTQPFTIDVTGPPNAGDIPLLVSYTSSGDSLNDGWSMVGNPYPCTIDWESTNWTKNKINSSIYIWNPDLGQFATYVPGVGTFGGSRYIASSQAFWVKTNGSSPSLIAKESCKINADQAFLKQAISDQQLLRFSLQVGAKSDEAVLRFIDGATAIFDAEFDAQKLSSADIAMPYLSLLGENYEYTVNSFGIGEQVSIPIKVTTPTSGLSSLTFDKENLTDLSCAVLEDLETGIITDLMTQSSYTFYLQNTTSEPRFMLHIWNNKNKEIIEPSCFESSDASILTNASGNGPWTYNWSNTSDLITSTNSNNNSNTLSNISAGTYIVETVDQSSTCEATIDTILITNPNPISLTSAITNPSAGLNDGSIDLIVSGGTPPYQFLWTNGATIEDLENIGQGVYEVEVTDANNCITNQTFTLDIPTGVTILDASLGVILYPNPVDDKLTIEIKEKNVNFTLFNLNGKLILSSQLISTVNTIDVSAINSGIYFYEVSNAKGINLVKGKLIVTK